MDNYIVRIYRRKRDNPLVLVGLVEEVGTKGKKAFNDLDDPWKILNSKERNVSSSGGGNSSVHKEERCEGEITA